MTGTHSKLDVSWLTGGRKDWLLPVIGTAAGLAFAATFSAALRILRGFAKAREAAFDPPQAILVLGGDKERESLAAKFAASLGERSFTRMVKPESHAAGLRLLPVYISSGYDDAASVMLHAGVHPSRLRIDNRALDTVTNFTTMLATFVQAEYSHVYVVTSDYHAARASMLATIVLCSHGIAFTAIILPSKSATASLAAAAAKSDRPARVPPLSIPDRPARPGHERTASSSSTSSSASASVRQGRRLEDSSAAASATQAARRRNKVEPKEDGLQDQQPDAQPSGASPTEPWQAEGPSDRQRGEGGEAGVAGGVAPSATTQTTTTTRSGIPMPSSLSKHSGSTFLEASGTGPGSSAGSANGVLTSESAEQIEVEGWARLERDRARALLWLLTGWHGAELLRFTRPSRYRLHKQKPLHPDVSKEN